MSGPPAVLKNLRIYATAVIANAQPQLGRGKRDFCFDLLRERMTKRVNQRLTANLIGVIADNWIQGPRRALQNDLKRYRVFLCKFSIHQRERFGEVDIFFFSCSQTFDSIPPFDDHLVGTVESAFEQLASGLSDRYLVDPGLEAPYEALNALEKRVMQFARDTLPFRQPLFEPALDLRGSLLQPEKIEQPHDCSAACPAEQLKPDCLVERRSDTEIKGSSGFIPNTVIIASQDAEMVVTRTKIRILHPPVVDHFFPFPILALKLIPKMDTLWSNEAQRCVVDPKIAQQRRQAQPGARVVSLAIHDNSFDVHRRREFVRGKMTRI